MFLYPGYIRKCHLPKIAEAMTKSFSPKQRSSDCRIASTGQRTEWNIVQTKVVKHNNCNSWCKGPLKTRACQPTIGLTFICPFTIVDYYLIILTVKCGHHLSYPSAVGLVDRNFLYILVATQIPHDAGWHRFHTLSENYSPNADRTNAATVVRVKTPCLKPCEHGTGA